MLASIEIVLDTETTGLDPALGHRLVEIGCVELKNHVPTGRVFHQYINPERDVPEEAFRVHGLSHEFLQQHPPFASVAQAFLAFVADHPLIIHNASFDMKFINYQLECLELPQIPMTRTIDTLKLARQRYKGGRYSLDALCQRLGIDNSNRVKHGALLDAELLADVYLEMRGGRQPDFGLGDSISGTQLVARETSHAISATIYPVRTFSVSAAEKAAHEAFLQKIKDPMWKKAG
jgi:DNA polymerase-3 subunit epsilon